MSTMPQPAVQDAPRSEPGPPPLQSGDRLTAAEFERRYRLHPEIKKAELIEGVVYVPSPVYLSHAEYHAACSAWLVVYRAHTSGVRVADNVSIRLDADNEVQPDLAVFVDPAGKLPTDRILEARPTLVVEIAASSAAYDFHQKQHVYRRHGIPEYLALAVYERTLTWFRWEEGTYRSLDPDEQGILRSQALPGLWLDPQALLQGDLARVLAVLQEGLSTPEHQAFVERLRGTPPSASSQGSSQGERP